MGSEITNGIIWAKTLGKATVEPYWGDILNLYMNSPLGQQVGNQQQMAAYIRIPIRHEQIRIYGTDQTGEEVLAVAAWACFNEVEEAKFEKQGFTSHWNCGDRIYLMDVIAKRLNMFKVMRELRQYGFQRYGQRHFKFYRQDYAKGTSRKGWC